MRQRYATLRRAVKLSKSRRKRGDAGAYVLDGIASKETFPCAQRCGVSYDASAEVIHAPRWKGQD